MAGAIGFTFSLHYCSGHFKDICFTEDTEKGCCGKSEHKRNCCNDKVFSAKFKSDHTPTAKAIISKLAAAALPARVYVYFQPSTYSAESQIFAANDSSPPPMRGVPLYIMNCVFRV